MSTTATSVTIANEPHAKFGYVAGLDGLRLVAVLIVIVAHYQIVGLFPGGFGVSIFFFISGFLITRLLLAEEKRNGSIALGRFYVRRFLRLLPPLLLMGIISVPILAALFPSEFSVRQVILSFLYLGNIDKPGVYLFGWKEGLDAVEPLWSLAVEEHFYLLLPAALLLIRGRIGRLCLIVGAIVVAVVSRFVIFGLLPVETADQINYHFTLTRLDALALGVLLTLVLDYGWIKIPRGWWAHVIVWGGVALMGLSLVHWSVIYEVVIKYTVQSTAIGIAFVGVIFAPNFGWARRVLEFAPISHLGKISYELYLWHFPVLVAVGVRPRPFEWWSFASLR